MNDAGSLALNPSQEADRFRLLTLAWLVVLLLTVPEIILRAFMQADTSWMLSARLILLIGIIVLASVVQWIRPLRGFALVLLVIYAAESFFLTLIPQSELYRNIFGSSANLLFFGERLLRIGTVLVMLLLLLGMGLKRHDFYLTLGKLNATAEADNRLHIPPKAEPWTRLGRNFGLISIAILLFFMLPAIKPSLSNFSIGLVVFAAICAAINSFAEEFLYRCALLPQLLPFVSKNRTLALVAIWFGLAHYFGIPSGITGVLITALGGWIFAKSMVETRGLGWAWFLHFLSDFTIYLLILLAGGF
ncbi:MAG: CPBP family intramembrane glutamic endopeptidase [Chloroflexota bacterium]